MGDGQPGGGGGLWAARPSGDGAAGRAVVDNRWVGSAAGEATIVVRKGGVEG
jgi:hypothetical protein